MSVTEHENMISLKGFWDFLIKHQFIPVLSVSSLLQGKVGWKSLNSLSWRLWITTILVCYMTINGWSIIFYFQRCLSIWREICYCDAIWMIRSTDLVEGIFLALSPYGKSVNYLMCRSFCL